MPVLFERAAAAGLPISFGYNANFMALSEIDRGSARSRNSQIPRVTISRCGFDTVLSLTTNSEAALVD